MYSAILLKHFHDDTHVGALHESLSNVFSIESGEPGLSDYVKLYVTLNNTGSIIETARFNVLGAPALIACLSYACQQCEGKPLSFLQSLGADNMIDVLQLSKVQQGAALRVVSLLQQLAADLTHKNIGTQHV